MIGDTGSVSDTSNNKHSGSTTKGTASPPESVFFNGAPAGTSMGTASAPRTGPPASIPSNHALLGASTGIASSPGTAAFNQIPAYQSANVARRGQGSRRGDNTSPAVTGRMGDEHQWNENFQRLKASLLCFGNSIMAGSFADKSQMGAWIADQRRAFKTGRLPLERQRKLESIQFVFHTPFNLNTPEFAISPARKRPVNALGNDSEMTEDDSSDDDDDDEGVDPYAPTGIFSPRKEITTEVPKEIAKMVPEQRSTRVPEEFSTGSPEEQLEKRCRDHIVQQSCWDDLFQRLTVYKEMFGDCNGREHVMFILWPILAVAYSFFDSFFYQYNNSASSL